MGWGGGGGEVLPAEWRPSLLSELGARGFLEPGDSVFSSSFSTSVTEHDPVQNRTEHGPVQNRTEHGRVKNRTEHDRVQNRTEHGSVKNRTEHDRVNITEHGRLQIHC